MRTEPRISGDVPPTAASALPKRVDRTAAVNGWRGPGAIAIALAHIGIATDAISSRYIFPLALLVDLFFVISGLVIAQAYATKLTRASNIPEYVIRRFGRIWPMQAATLAVLVGYEALKALLEALGLAHFSSPAFSRDGISTLSSIPTNLLLVQSLGPHDRWTWNYPSWSLSVEFVTYIAFALFCLFTPHLRRALSIATVAASIAVLVLVAPYGMFSTFDYGIFRCLAGFFAGTLCFETAERWPLPRVRYPTLVEVAAVALIGLWLCTAAYSLFGFAAPILFGLFVLVFLGEGGLVSRLLKSRVLQVLADLSFSIYMVHSLVLTALLAFAHALGKVEGVSLFKAMPNPFADRPGAHATVDLLHVDGFGKAVLILVLYLAGVAAAAIAAYHLVEVPGRELFNRLAKRLSELVASGHRQTPALSSIEPSP